MIKVWHSYSCNNSSNFRLVARFAEPFQAAETAVELRAFLAEHAAAVDSSGEELFEGDGITAPARALADKYGFAWDGLLMWGGGGTEQVGDEPEVAAEGNVLLVYHGYCSGFDPGIARYLEVRGATSVDEDMANANVSVLFQFNGSDALAKDLDLLIAQSGSIGNNPLRTPWNGEECYGDAVFFRDAGTVGLYFPIRPNDLPKLRDWLSEHDVLGASIELCVDSDLKLFEAVAKARCTSCKGPLHYLDPRIADIEVAQFLCPPCGGLYDLATFVK